MERQVSNIEATRVAWWRGAGPIDGIGNQSTELLRERSFRRGRARRSGGRVIAGSDRRRGRFRRLDWRGAGPVSSANAKAFQRRVEKRNDSGGGQFNSVRADLQRTAVRRSAIVVD